MVGETRTIGYVQVRSIHPCIKNPIPIGVLVGVQYAIAIVVVTAPGGSGVVGLVLVEVVSGGVEDGNFIIGWRPKLPWVDSNI